jgi:hypothetical protein
MGRDGMGGKWRDGREGEEEGGVDEERGGMGAGHSTKSSCRWLSAVGNREGRAGKESIVIRCSEWQRISGSSRSDSCRLDKIGK